MARKNSDAGDLVRAVIPVITDLVPLFLEKWAELNERPTLTKIERQQEKIQERTDEVKGKAVLLGWVCAALVVWNAVLTYLVLTKMH